MDRRKAIIVVSEIVVIALILVSLTTWYMGQPQFCKSCHEMQTVYWSWNYSKHAHAAVCLDCHALPGIAGQLKAHLNSGRYIWAKISGKVPLIFMAKIANISCKKCHPDNEFDNRANEPIIAHLAHEKQGIRCMDCHANLVHSTFRATDVKPPIEVCKGCHRRRAVRVKEERLFPVTQQFKEVAN